MIPTNPRELEKLLKRMGIKVEEVDVAYVELRLKNGEVVRINNPTVALMKMPNKVLLYQIQTSEAAVERVQQQQQQPQQGGYQPSEDDIALVMEQTGATREEAVNALVEAKGDLVQAAMKILSKKRGG
ncbi:nascent polypeptide-associated complex protein [Pyrobaculum neutrophilum]|uniref:Nascent polypeptide-associated complex protein n=1 Tax=Pyrobaculum neutrophilum (strain DSM 2338 / JCM 9278 / NBRC 100436 / V24Sta) TaxID=444157 RepID=B1YDH5_PYRNV|nr:nascent polypeptide-associated complex protein [Pyrobaculum neutrophilum]ACB39838.1 ubiquitin-associated- domain-containing protein [Pyrobaculum neutrophilum V24Sta]